jgi:FKBP-type peptidyl-prolyl cis-trans isomerase
MRYGWLILFLLVVIGTGCGKKPVGTMARPTGWTAKWDTEKAIVTPSGLKYEDEKVGDGPEAKRGTKVSLQYTGRVAVTSQIFQTNVGKPLAEFRVGAKEALPGVDEGVLGMKVGGKRRLYVPAALGFGDRGLSNSVLPGADLVFDLELVKVTR